QIGWKKIQRRLIGSERTDTSESPQRQRGYSPAEIRESALRSAPGTSWQWAGAHLEQLVRQDLVYVRAGSDGSRQVAFRFQLLECSDDGPAGQSVFPGDFPRRRQFHAWTQSASEDAIPQRIPEPAISRNGRVTRRQSNAKP